MTGNELIGMLSLLVGLAGTGIYIASILRGQTRPHLFTWLVWFILTVIGYLAQLHDDRGPGTWVMGVTALCALAIVALSLKYGEKNRTRGDWIALALSLTAIIPWLLTKDPLGSVLMISVIDLVAFYPTFRKSWLKPHEENLTGYVFANAKYLLGMAALNAYTLNTTLYAATIIAANAAFILMCLWRRHMLKEKIRI